MTAALSELLAREGRRCRQQARAGAAAASACLPFFSSTFFIQSLTSSSSSFFGSFLWTSKRLLASLPSVSLSPRRWRLITAIPVRRANRPPQPRRSALSINERRLLPCDFSYGLRSIRHPVWQEGILWTPWVQLRQPAPARSRSRGAMIQEPVSTASQPRSAPVTPPPRNPFCGTSLIGRRQITRLGQRGLHHVAGLVGGLFPPRSQTESRSAVHCAHVFEPRSRRPSAPASGRRREQPPVFEDRPRPRWPLFTDRAKLAAGLGTGQFRRGRNCEA